MTQDDDFAIYGPKSFNRPQFTADEVRAVCGLSAGALKGILDRKQIDIGDDHFPGSGRRRLFSASNIFKVYAANVANEIGYPLRFANQLGEIIVARAFEKISGASLRSRVHFALAIDGTNPDNPAYVEIVGDRASQELPAAYRYIDVDRVVDETLVKLEAMIDDRPQQAEE